MLTSAASRGWALVKAKPIVSVPLTSYLTYGRWLVGAVISVRGGVQPSLPSAWIENAGRKLPPRQNRYVDCSSGTWTGFGYVKPNLPAVLAGRLRGASHADTSSGASDVRYQSCGPPWRE